MQIHLKKSIGYNINKTANFVNSLINQALQPYDIAIEQIATLEIIKYEEDVNQTMIAQILVKDKTTISRTLKTLETKGYITKVSLDKRTNLIKLTPQGEEVLEKSSVVVQSFREKLKSRFTDEELKQFFESLDKVVASISE